MIGKVFGFLAIPALIIGVIWLGTVIHFQQSGTDIDADGIVTWFILLPLAAVLLWFAGKALYKFATRPAADAQDTAASSEPPVVADNPALQFQLAIISAELHTPAGAAADQLLPDIRAGQLQPELNDSLQNQDGHPVKASVCVELDTTDAALWVDTYLASQPADSRPDGDIAEAARLITLLSGPLDKALDSLAALPPLADPAANVGTAHQTEPARRPLVTKLFVPPAWQDLIAAYVREKVNAQGGFAFGLVRADVDKPELQRDATRVADAFCVGSKGALAQSVLMIVACDSLISAAQLEALEARQQLFSAANQSGLVPGEAAAVLIAVPVDSAPSDPAPIARLHRAAFGARQKPVDGSGRIEAQFMSELAERTLANAQQSAASICALISDCDQRSAWATESAMLMTDSFTELDAVEDHLAIGRALGHTGYAHSTLALALAAAHTNSEARPVVLASMHDRLARSLVVLSPWLPPET